jgi:beta-1,4-mannosyl-glycoprotein beta-1,4-N-acetylglucosaminyltransferase
MIYDCVPLWNTDLLEIRLNVLKDVVDVFVIGEASKTFTGGDKPFNFENDKARFAEFLPRIKYVKIDFPPEVHSALEHETYQRNEMARALTAAQPDDWIMVSDLDEIPSPAAVKMASSKDDAMTIFEQRFFHYFLNNESYRKWCGTAMFQYKNFGKIGSIQKVRDIQAKFDAIRNARHFPYCIKTAAEIIALKHIRRLNVRIAKDGGWHFSFIGGAQKIRDKLRSYTDEKWATAGDDERQTDYMIRNGINVGNGKKEFHRVAIDESFPAYVREHQDKYKSYILEAE